MRRVGSDVRVLIRFGVTWRSLSLSPALPFSHGLFCSEEVFVFKDWVVWRTASSAVGLKSCLNGD